MDAAPPKKQKFKKADWYSRCISAKTLLNLPNYFQSQYIYIESLLCTNNLETQTNIKKAHPKSSRRAFLMYTDTVTTIYRVSIPFSLICSFTASIGTSSLWKMPAARAASALVFLKTFEKYSTLPAPLRTHFWKKLRLPVDMLNLIWPNGS